jgi:hypothetical protein
MVNRFITVSSLVIKRKSAKVHQYGSGQKTAYFWFYPVTLLLLGLGAVMLRRK